MGDDIGARGELSSTQVITIVLALAGFIIALLFLGIAFSDSSAGDDEVCRLSVLSRATSPDVVQAAVPLKCTTGKICVSFSGKDDECSQFLGEDVVPVKLDSEERDPSARGRNIEFVQKFMADEMYSCWSTMGKGKLDLFGSAADELGLGDVQQATCVICKRLAFSDEVVASGLVEEARAGFGAYLLNTPFESADESYGNYIEAFTDRAMSAYPNLNEIKARKSDGKLNEVSGELEGNRENQLAIVFAQNKPKDWQDVLKNWGYVMIGTALQGPGGLKGKGALTLVAGGVGAFGSWNAYLGQNLAASYCGKFASAASENLRGGCSLIQIVEYNVKDINALCPSVQGNP